jgi:hypothetical protein
VLPWQVYPCRRTQQLLLEVGVDVHEAERVVRDGLLELSLISNPASSSPQATKSSSARAVIPGLTQHVVQQACKLAANAGMLGLGPPMHRRSLRPQGTAQQHAHNSEHIGFYAIILMLGSECLSITEYMLHVQAWVLNDSMQAC